MFHVIAFKDKDFVSVAKGTNGNNADAIHLSSKYNRRMDIPDKIVTMMELRRNTGERGTRLWIACAGIVYDVTDCPKWRTGLHELLHFAGQDLTSEFPEAPHKLEVFKHDCVKAIGRLKVEG